MKKSKRLKNDPARNERRIQKRKEIGLKKINKDTRELKRTVELMRVLFFQKMASRDDIPAIGNGGYILALKGIETEEDLERALDVIFNEFSRKLAKNCAKYGVDVDELPKDI